jgi:hypothetical protein
MMTPADGICLWSRTDAAEEGARGSAHREEELAVSIWEAAPLCLRRRSLADDEP